MSMEFTMGAGGVPAGNYFGEFVGAEPFTDNADKYGEGVLLRWRVIGGEQDGNETSRICSAKLRKKTMLGKFAVALKGGPIEVGETFSFANHMGIRGSLIVEETDSGSTRVSAFIRQQDQPMPQPESPPTEPVTPQSVAQPTPPQEASPTTAQF